MKNLFKLVTIVALIGILSGCRKTEEVVKDSADVAPETATDLTKVTPEVADDSTKVAPKTTKGLNVVYNGVTLGDNTMPEGARAKADSIAAEAATPVK